MLAPVLAAALLGASPSAPPAPPETVTIAAVGHIVMGTSYPPGAPALPPDGGVTLFQAARDVLRGADVTFGNLAAPLSDRGETKKKVDGVTCFAFRTPPAYGEWLKDSGFDVVQAANNHIFDFGPDAYEDTLKTLDALGIGHTGRKDEAWYTTVHGIRVGVVGFTQPYHDFFESHHDVAAAAEVIRKVKAKADVVLVGFHGGTEGPQSLHTPRARELLGVEDRGEVVKFAHAAVDAGADLVVGYGPHLPRAMEFYKGKLIDYALGNFVTYGPFNLKGPNGLTLILEATFDRHGTLLEAKAVPFVVPKPGIPLVDAANPTLAHLRKLSKEDFPESYPEIDDRGVVSPRR